MDTRKSAFAKIAAISKSQFAIHRVKFAYTDDLEQGAKKMQDLMNVLDEKKAFFSSRIKNLQSEFESLSDIAEDYRSDYLKAKQFADDLLVALQESAKLAAELGVDETKIGGWLQADNRLIDFDSYSEDELDEKIPPFSPMM